MRSLRTGRVVLVNGVLLGALLLFGASCGDDDGGNGTPDAALYDAGGADAAMQDAQMEDAEVADAETPDASNSDCVPPAEPGSLFELEADFKGEEEPVSLCDYRGEVILIVNVAANCGYTYQFGDLAQLQTDYGSQGLQVLGFYCNQFAGQAGTPQEQQAVEDNYGVNFPVSEILNVNPPAEHPIYTWLKSQPGGAGDISWNFEKFLVGRDGTLIDRWSTQTEADDADIIAAIEAALQE